MATSDKHQEETVVGTLSEADADKAAQERREQLQREAEQAAGQPVTHYNAHLDATNADTGTLNAPADAHERAAKHQAEQDKTAGTAGR
jgi:hypothetical protein